MIECVARHDATGAGMDDTTDLLERLRATAALSPERARALPPGVYHDSGFHALEIERIFRRDWCCAGRASAIPGRGDWFSWQIADQPVLVIRGSDGTVRAYANICRHRMMRLMEGQGTCRRIVCPYHAWTYDIDGRLLAAAHMERTESFARSEVRLKPVRCEIWRGWIYLCLEDAAPAVAELLAPLDDLVARYRMEDYVEIVREDHVWNTNWKLLAENFMEGYHLPVTHRRTVGAYFPVEQTEFGDRANKAFTLQLFRKTTEAPIGTAHPDNTRLEGLWRATSVMPSVFPGHLYVLAPDHLWYLSLQPRGIGQVAIRYGVALAPEKMAGVEAGDDRSRREITDFLWQVNLEDRAVVEALFAGTAAPLAEPGALSWLERGNHEFAAWLVRRLTG